MSGHSELVREYDTDESYKRINYWCTKHRKYLDLKAGYEP